MSDKQEIMVPDMSNLICLPEIVKKKAQDEMTGLINQVVHFIRSERGEVRKALAEAKQELDSGVDSEDVMGNLLNKPVMESYARDIIHNPDVYRAFKEAAMDEISWMTNPEGAVAQSDEIAVTLTREELAMLKDALFVYTEKVDEMGFGEQWGEAINTLKSKIENGEDALEMAKHGLD